MKNVCTFTWLACLGMATTNAHAVIISTTPTVTGYTSHVSGGYVESKAADNNATTEYASNGGAADTWLNFNFGTNISFDRVVLIGRNSGDGGDRFSQVTLTYDGGPTSTLATNSGQAASGIYSTGPVTAQNIRLDVDVLGSGSATNTGLTEAYFLKAAAGSQLVTTVTAYNSSTAYSGYSMTAAVNGLIGGGPSHEYASAGQGNSTFVDFDLGAMMSITGFDYFDRLGGSTTSFDLVFSDTANFSNVLATKSYSKASGLLATSDSFAGVNARYVRYDVQGQTDTNAGLSEIIFYQAVPEPGAALLGGLGLLGLLRRRRD